MKAIYHQFEPVIVRWVVGAIVLALVLLLASVAAACPTCKDGLAQNDPHGQALAAGYAYSVLFMMSMPYLVLCTMGSMAYLAIRRARNANAAADVATISAGPDVIA
jgi:uncharacterized paraquat-inducible protein A